MQARQEPVIMTTLPTNAVQPLLVSVPTAAALLGIGQVTMWGLVSKGTIKSCKINRSRRVAYAELQRFAAELAEAS